MIAAGGIFSNVIDLSKFAIANFSNDTILKLQRTITYQTTSQQIALGWNTFKIGDNDAISGFWHGGGTGGYSSFFVLDVNNKMAVIILTNVSAFFPDNGKISILGFELLKNLYLKNKLPLTTGITIAGRGFARVGPFGSPVLHRQQSALMTQRFISAGVRHKRKNALR